VLNDHTATAAAAAVRRRRLHSALKMRR